MCCVVSDTLKALELGAVEMLLIWDSLEMLRLELRNNQSGEVTVLHLNPDQERDRSLFVDKDSGTELEVIDRQQLIDWFATNYKKFGTTLEFITDRSQEGSQFCKGFGGIGGVLRYQVDFSSKCIPPSLFICVIVL